MKKNNERQESILEGKDMFYLEGEADNTLRGDYILERLGITEKTLFMLAESGEFPLGRIGSAKIVITESFYEFLDKNHFQGRKSPDEIPAVDALGIIKPDLTLVKEKHNSVPKLYPIKHFAEDLGIETRTFIRHCEKGTFRHYRIGTLYKMSKEDYEKSLENVAQTNMKSNRGSGIRKNVGRPDKVKNTIERRYTEEKTK